MNLHSYQHHLHLRGHGNHSNHGHHHLHSIPPGRPPSGSGGDSSGYHSSGGKPKANLRSSRSSDSSSAYRYVQGLSQQSAILWTIITGWSIVSGTVSLIWSRTIYIFFFFKVHISIKFPAQVILCLIYF